MRRFERNDLQQINNWYRARSLPLCELNDLPVVGFIIDNLACGFLYQTDSQICIAGNYIANPHSNERDRRRAIIKISDEIYKYAKESNYKRIFVSTKRETLKDLALDMKFKDLGDYSILLGE